MTILETIFMAVLALAAAGVGEMCIRDSQHPVYNSCGQKSKQTFEKRKMPQTPGASGAEGFIGFFASR